MCFWPCNAIFRSSARAYSLGREKAARLLPLLEEREIDVSPDGRWLVGGKRDGQIERERFIHSISCVCVCVCCPYCLRVEESFISFFTAFYMYWWGETKVRHGAGSFWKGNSIRTDGGADDDNTTTRGSSSRERERERERASQLVAASLIEF